MAFINELLGKFFGKEEYRILALGLDASGMREERRREVKS
jgi:hypothetical protein